MGNVCGRDDEVQKEPSVHNNLNQGQGMVAAHSPLTSDPLVPERRAPSPAGSFEDVTDLTKLNPIGYAPTSKNNQIHPNVQRAINSRKPRKLEDFPGTRDYAGNPSDKLEDTTSGSIYQGHVVRGVPHGWGCIISKKGEVLEGLFDNGRPVKHLRFVTEDGSDYEGELQDGKRHGNGTLIRGDRSSISCATWQFGVATGVVEERDPLGQLIFKGRRNQRGNYEGRCTVGHKGFLIEGEFVDGVHNGVCKKTYTDGRVYEGTLDNDLVEEGKGSLIFVDGRKFEGPFVKGQPNGKGTFTSDTGKTVDQTWKDGRRV